MEAKLEKQARSREPANCTQRGSMVLLLALVIILTSACVHSPPLTEPVELPVPEPETARPATPPAPAGVEVEPVAIPEHGLFIVVSKSNRLMTVYSDAEVVH